LAAAGATYRKEKSIRNNHDRLEDLLRFQKVLLSPILNLQDAALYLGMKPAELYKLSLLEKIPHHQPVKNRLYFKRKALDRWMCHTGQFNSCAKWLRTIGVVIRIVVNLLPFVLQWVHGRFWMT